MNSNSTKKLAAQLARCSVAAMLTITTAGAAIVPAQRFSAAQSLSSKPLAQAAASAAQVQMSWGGASAPAVSLSAILNLSLEPRAHAPGASALQARRSWGGAAAPVTTSLTGLESQATAPVASAWQAWRSWGGAAAPVTKSFMSSSLKLGANAPAASALQARRSWGGASAPVTTSLTGLEPQAVVRGNEPAASASQVRRSWGGASAPATRNPGCAAVAVAVGFNDSENEDKTGQSNQSKTKVTAPTIAAPTIAAPDDPQVFELMYENFRRTYRLGPADEIAVRVRLEPDYSIERAKISPDGRVFHPLLGDVVAGGLTVEQLTRKLKQDLLRYIKQPEVSVQLLEAKSAKVGVLGEVGHPGILPMAGPMTVLDAITQAGGFARTGSRNNVSLIRQSQTGKYQTLSVDVKKLLAGKADAEENLPLQPGDTVIVHGNFLKKLEYVTALTGFTQFLTFVALTR